MGADAGGNVAVGLWLGCDMVVWPQTLLATAAKIATIAIAVGRVLLADPIRTIALRTEGRGGRQLRPPREIGDDLKEGWLMWDVGITEMWIQTGTGEWAIPRAWKRRGPAPTQHQLPAC